MEGGTPPVLWRVSLLSWRPAFLTADIEFVRTRGIQGDCGTRPLPFSSLWPFSFEGKQLPLAPFPHAVTLSAKAAVTAWDSVMTWGSPADILPTRVVPGNWTEGSCRHRRMGVSVKSRGH